MENLGAVAYSRYTGFCEITDSDVLELHCTSNAYHVWHYLTGLITFVKIDHEIISTVILQMIEAGQLSVTGESMCISTGQLFKD